MAVSPLDLAHTLLRRAGADLARDRAERDRCIDAVTRAVTGLRGELRFGRAWLIGSLAWGGFGPRSDVDLVVEGLADADRIALADRLGEATGRSVDLLLLEELPPAFQARVLAEGHDVG